MLHQDREIIAADVKPLYRVQINNLTEQGIIGVYDFEKVAPQRIRINIELLTEQACTAHGEIVNSIREIIASGHIHLVETLAENIAQNLLRDFFVLSVRVRVEKLDIIEDATSVGVEIERYQRNAC